MNNELKNELRVDQIDLGKKVLEDLSSRMPIAVAFWYLLPDSGWRYVLASPQFDKLVSVDAYEALQEELDNISDPEESTFINNVSIVKTSHPLVGLLKQAINTGSEAISGIRFTGNVINDQYIKDAYIYRVS